MNEVGITLGIDASNITSGGGLTHLISILNFFDPQKHNIKKIVLWASHSTISKLPKRDFITVRTNCWIQGNLLKRMLWQNFFLNSEIKSEEVEVLFSPGGVIPVFLSIPTVTISQNMLPFEWSEMVRFGLTNPLFFKMLLLRIVQSTSFKRSSGVIFLSEYAREKVSEAIGKHPSFNEIIPHGIENRFRFEPKKQYSISSYTFERPFKLLYVSSVMPYKHQLLVVDAVNILRSRGIPLTITFIGESWGWYADKLKEKIKDLDPGSEYLIWHRSYPYNSIHNLYREYDLFIFASTCENLPNILIEAMASGMPILCSDKNPMIEVLGDSALLFKPNNLISLVDNLQALIYDAKLREFLSFKSSVKSKTYSWEKCADETLKFIVSVVKG